MLVMPATERASPFYAKEKCLAFSLSQDLSSLHDFDDLGKCCRIGDGGTRPHALYITNRDLRLFAYSRLHGLSIQAAPAHTWPAP